MTADPAPLEAIAFDADGHELARAALDGTGRIVFDLPDGAVAELVRWAGEDGVAHDYAVPQPVPVGKLDPPANPDAPHGACPTCGRNLPLDVDPGGARFVPLHGGWPPCDGSGMDA